MLFFSPPKGGDVEWWEGFFLFINVKHFCFLLIFVIIFNMIFFLKPNFNNTGSVLISAKRRGEKYYMLRHMHYV